MDGVGRRDLAAGSVIETIHYRFHNSTIPHLHFRGDNYAERLAVGWSEGVKIGRSSVLQHLFS